MSVRSERVDRSIDECAVAPASTQEQQQAHVLLVHCFYSGREWKCGRERGLVVDDYRVQFGFGVRCRIIVLRTRLRIESRYISC